MGIDAIAHNAAGSNNTIAVVANGLDIRYPKINSKLIESIEDNGLVLSSYTAGVKARGYHFVQRNEIVVALGEVLIVSQADLNSGSMRSVEFAKQMGKKIYVLPHRIGQSDGTNYLLKNKIAQAIYDVDEFIADVGKNNEIQIDQNSDPILVYCEQNPTYDEAVSIYGNKIFEYELMGKINIQNGIIYV